MARITAGAAGCGVLALMALPATAAVRDPQPSGRATTSGQPANRYNTGATHSPQVLRQLAHSATGGPTAPIAGAQQGVDVASFQHPNGAAIHWT